VLFSSLPPYSAQPARPGNTEGHSDGRRRNRKSLEKEFASKRKTVEKRTRKELKRIQSELKKNPIVKRADAVRKDVTKQVETRVDSLLGLMQVASRSDVQRINKKLTTLNRRLKAIEESRKTNGSSPSI